MMKKFLIFTPKYGATNGGVICLHYLCHLINNNGGEAYLVPYFKTFEINKNELIKPFLKSLYSKFISLFRKFTVNPIFDTPLVKNLNKLDMKEWIIIYPEITFGNPLNGENIVRWYLHNPGFHSGKIYFSSGELCFKYHDGFSGFTYPKSVMSKNILNISYYPTNFYNMNGVSVNRTGVAYAIRKGRGRKIEHKLEGAILIDELSHFEVSEIFKKVSLFISYDLYTAYSYFASMCGCDSVVMPMDGISEEQWYPQEESRYGVAYGFEKLEIARATRQKLINKVNQEQLLNSGVVVGFIKESNSFFDKDLTS